MITEQIARSLTIEELAQRLADEHDDPVVRYFAAQVPEAIDKRAAEYVEAEDDRDQQELEDAKHDLENLKDDIETLLAKY